MSMDPDLTLRYSSVEVLCTFNDVGRENLDEIYCVQDNYNEFGL